MDEEVDELDEDDDDEDMAENDEDVGSTSTPMTTAPEPLRSSISLPPLSQLTANSSPPPIFGAGAGRHHSISSASQTSFSPFFHSNQPSPSFGPQLQLPPTIPTFGGVIGLESHALEPIDQLRKIAASASDLTETHGPASSRQRRSEHELDQEATAALLMLNHDRRQWRAARQEGGGGGQQRRTTPGMSVRDLLSN